uniref:Uncharacterized protein n=1 Tax=Chromera velia CCMP2878 TaxID=1169474 RepID=A0A0G4HJ48_9ALVE|eukprot:Cvel_28153.t1-p1 / transcript=Cvel_28153.t1 / gene=Cvel_28153 / organism=Chromera_velia_CCMP2878 / gene_product=hypothetical protein / transcript_product=hypothetical protein / location=Cvel_scaffold3635:6807-8291(-) / protein_length=495 / sequence_SO=supercontig / SO=protein_coding / is_pseudo=false
MGGQYVSSHAAAPLLRPSASACASVSPPFPLPEPARPSYTAVYPPPPNFSSVPRLQPPTQQGILPGGYRSTRSSINSQEKEKQKEAHEGSPTKVWTAYHASQSREWNVNPLLTRSSPLPVRTAETEREREDAFPSPRPVNSQFHTPPSVPPPPPPLERLPGDFARGSHTQFQSGREGAEVDSRFRPAPPNAPSPPPPLSSSCIQYHQQQQGGCELTEIRSTRTPIGCHTSSGPRVAPHSYAGRDTRTRFGRGGNGGGTSVGYRSLPQSPSGSPPHDTQLPPGRLPPALTDLPHPQRKRNEYVGTAPPRLTPRSHSSFSTQNTHTPQSQQQQQQLPDHAPPFPPPSVLDRSCPPDQHRAPPHHLPPPHCGPPQLPLPLPVHTAAMDDERRIPAAGRPALTQNSPAGRFPSAAQRTREGSDGWHTEPSAHCGGDGIPFGVSGRPFEWPPSAPQGDAARALPSLVVPHSAPMSSSCLLHRGDRDKEKAASKPAFNTMK